MSASPTPGCMLPVLSSALSLSDKSPVPSLKASSSGRTSSIPPPDSVSGCKFSILSLTSVSDCNCKPSMPSPASISGFMLSAPSSAASFSGCTLSIPPSSPSFSAVSASTSGSSGFKLSFSSATFSDSFTGSIIGSSPPVKDFNKLSRYSSSVAI